MALTVLDVPFSLEGSARYSFISRTSGKATCLDKNLSCLLCLEEISVELMTSDRKLKVSREVSK